MGRGWAKCAAPQAFLSQGATGFIMTSFSSRVAQPWTRPQSSPLCFHVLPLPSHTPDKHYRKPEGEGEGETSAPSRKTKERAARDKERAAAREREREKALKANGRAPTTRVVPPLQKARAGPAGADSGPSPSKTPPPAPAPAPVVVDLLDFSEPVPPQKTPQETPQASPSRAAGSPLPLMTDHIPDFQDFQSAPSAGAAGSTGAAGGGTVPSQANLVSKQEQGPATAMKASGTS